MLKTCDAKTALAAVAASTAAFRARMLVWKAMPSMTPMISPMRWEDAEMEFIVLTTSSSAPVKT